MLKKCMAWDLFRRIFHENFDTMKRHLVTLVKRVALEKRDGLCADKDIRPIDIFSVLMRIVSSATYRLVRSWAMRVLHPDQYATQGGAVLATCRLAWATELSWVGVRTFFAVSCDFSKMFNKMSVDIATDSAKFMGLSDHLASVLAKPIEGSAYAWKLPYDAKPIEVRHERGLPQGLAGSVLLAECMIAPLLWKCHHLLKWHAYASMIAYVDDLNFILPSIDLLARVIELIMQYRDHFFLDLSLAKSVLWATQLDSISPLSTHHEIPTAKTLMALGAEWPTTKGADPVYAKETARYEEAEKRLLRVRHMPLSVGKKMAIISSTCLSTLDYVNHPSISSVKHLRALVKRALGQQYAAPEILYNCFVASTLDPCIRWLLAGMRMWHGIIQHEELTHMKAVKRGQGRLGNVARVADKYGIHVTEQGIVVGEASLPPSYPWSFFRRKILDHLKDAQLRELAERREATFGGLHACAYKAHRRFLLSKNEYDQASLLKLWTGAIMTRAKHAKMGDGDGLCECGVTQDVHHLLWECPMHPPPPPAIAYLAAYPPHRSVAHILPQGADNRDIEHWKASCMRAINILCSDTRLERVRLSREGGRDMKGHLVANTEGGLYTYCMRCFISRRSRDAAWIFLKPCSYPGRDPLPEGGEVEQKGHRCVMQMDTWKQSAQRPRLVCKRCDQRVWATMGFKRACTAS